MKHAGLLLRVCIILAALCVCVHVYLERGRVGAPVPMALGLSARASGDGGAQPLSKRVSPKSTTEGLPATLKQRRVSYIRTTKKDGVLGTSGWRREDHAPSCCPPLRSRKKSPRWHIDLEDWANESHSLEEEARRFLRYITTPQVSCESMASEFRGHREPGGPWAVCLDPKYGLAQRIHDKHCRAYSLGLGVGDRSLERSLAKAGCEVHCFDPSLKQPHQQQAEMWLHRLSVDWRDPNPAVVAQHQHANTKKLANILNDFGHRQVDVLKADMESAEWKILENLVLEGVLESVGQLLLELHLHWAGFEVGGDDQSVVRYWFSLLKELERANFRLFRCHSNPAKPHLFLHKNVLNASSTYTLGWVNTQWKP